jgi:hypothetical protein
MATAVLDNLEADEAEPEFKLGRNAPSGWDPMEAYSVEITYRTENGKHIYEYKDAPTSPDLPLLPRATAIEGAWKSLATHEAGGGLDLKITSDCIVVMRTDDEKDISWSVDTAKQAIMTKGVGREDMYFGLRLYDQGIAYLPGDFPAGKVCKQISFGARLNSSGKPGDGHPFALYVMVEGTSDRIDPDIRNPGLS